MRRLLMLLLCTSCASPLQNADGSPLEFFNRRVLENPEWTLEAVTELGKYRAESICSDGEHLYVLCREQNQILKLDANGEFLGFIGSVDRCTDNIGVAVTDDRIHGAGARRSASEEISRNVKHDRIDAFHRQSFE